MSGYRLIWYSGRNTPRVVKAGSSAKKKPSEGKVVKSRAANADEVKTIRKGKWVRVDRNGKKAGQKGYGTGSKVRPQFKYNKDNGAADSARHPTDGNRGKKGEPPNQRRRTARLRGDDKRQESNFKTLEKSDWKKRQ